jgi:hypothetical protein
MFAAHPNEDQPWVHGWEIPELMELPGDPASTASHGNLISNGTGLM